jgi:hypothetical protein
MPLNGLNVGKDVSIDIITPQGTFNFNVRTDFKSKQAVEKRKSNAADGTIRHVWIPGGWEGSFKFDRGDANVDNFFCVQEALYYAGFPISTATITETITEVDGSISQYLYEGVQLALDDAGNKQGDDLVKGEIGFAASKRLQLV